MVSKEEGFALRRAKKYSNLKYIFSLAQTSYLILVILIFLRSGFSRGLAVELTSFNQGRAFLVPVYLLIVSLGYFVLDFPLRIYQTFILEHKFSLSNQKIGGWFIDQLKEGVLTYLIALILLTVFYLVLGSFRDWWAPVSLFWIFFSFVLARLTPTLIIPLFFKYKSLTDQPLRQRIISLADRMQVKIMDVFEIDFSKKTTKANAAFVGWGKKRRVLLADTLKDKYTTDEIEAILAHEFAHYKFKHLLKLIFINSLITAACFYCIFRTSGSVLSFFNLTGLSKVESLPLLMLYFVVFALFTQPLENFISRLMEANADRLALKIIGAKEPFISMMEKLGLQNLADRKVNPLIKFFFFDHPPIDERIDMANRLYA